MKKPYLRQIILLCLLASVSIGIMVNCAGLFYTPVSESLSCGLGHVSITSTIALLICACFSFFIPVLLYTFPYKHLLLSGILLSAGSTALMAFSSNLFLFYVLSVVKGIGMGLFSNTVITTIISNWFYEKSALITSVVMSCSGLAGAVLSPVFGACIDSFGWRAAYLIMAALSFVLVLPALLLPFRAFPLDMSLYPFGFQEVSENTEKEPDARFSYTSALFLVLAALCLICSLVTGLGQYISGFGQHCGLSVSAASMLLSFTMAGNITGKLLIGMLSDRLGPVSATLIMAIVNVASLLLLQICPDFDWMPLYSIAAFLYGSVYSLAAVASSLLTRYFYGPVLYVKAYAVIGFIVSAASAVALPVIGFIYDFSGSYNMVFSCGLILDAAFIILLLIAARLQTAARKRGIS